MVNDLLGRPWATPAPVTAVAPQPAPGKPPPVNLPNPPPPTEDDLTVDEAWEIFGISQKRATEDEVKRRYIAFLTKWHPDKHPDDQETATKQFTRAGQALALLKKYCKW